MEHRRIENIKTSFGGLFFAANRLETLCDRYLQPYDLTTKQFFLTIILEQNKDREPALTLTETATMLGTSRQNVKQLALKLQERGFCKIENDINDKRILRLSITEKNLKFWKSIDSKNIEFLKCLFNKFNDDLLESFSTSLKKLLEGIEKLEADKNS